MPYETGMSRSVRELYFELGQVLTTRERYSDASKAFEKAYGENDSGVQDVQILFSLAQSQQHNGEIQQAFRTYLEVISFVPEQCEKFLPLAHKLLTRSTAIAEREWLLGTWAKKFEQIQLSVIDCANIAFFLGRINLYVEDYEKALQNYEQAAANRILANDPRVLEGLGEALRQTGSLKRAIGVLKQARRLSEAGEHQERLLAIDTKLAQALVDSGQYEEALVRIETLMSMENAEHYFFELLLIRSQCYLALGKSVRALDAIEGALKRNSTSAYAYLIRAKALIALRRYQEAISSTNQALKCDPSNPLILFYKSQALIEGQIDFNQATRLLKRYIEHQSSQKVIDQVSQSIVRGRNRDGDARFFLAYFYWILRRFQEALQEINTALEIGLTGVPNRPDAPALQLKAELLAAVDRSIEAAHCLHEAGRSFIWRNEFQQATDLLKRAVHLREQAGDRNSDNALIYWDLSNALYLSSYVSEPPYVDRKKIEESQVAWEKGIQLDRPNSAEYSWVYVVRALINERKSMLSIDFNERWDLWWGAIVYLERSLLICREDSNRWAYLARYHRMVHNLANAYQAMRQALIYDPNNAIALNERIAILINMGRFDEAAKVIDRLDEVEPVQVASVSKVWVLINTKQASRALELAHYLVNVMPTDVSFRSLRGLCYRLMINPSSARDDYHTIWEICTSNPLEKQAHLCDYGWAAFHLRKINQAIEIFTALLDDKAQEHSLILWRLGLCNLANGDITEGEERLEQAIESGVSVQQSKELLYLDLNELEKIDNPHLRQVTRRIQKHIEALPVELIQLTSTVDKELYEILERSSQIEASQSWEWLAANASLARFYLEREQWRQAFEIYQRLQHDSERFPEAAIGFETSYKALQSEGDETLIKKRGSISFSETLPLISCPNCNAEFFSRKKFCNTCGNCLICTRCKTPVRNVQNQCSNCGASLKIGRSIFL